MPNIIIISETPLSPLSGANIECQDFYTSDIQVRDEYHMRLLVKSGIQWFKKIQKMVLYLNLNLFISFYLCCEMCNFNIKNNRIYIK